MVYEFFFVHPSLQYLNGTFQLSAGNVLIDSLQNSDIHAVNIFTFGLGEIRQSPK